MNEHGAADGNWDADLEAVWDQMNGPDADEDEPAPSPLTYDELRRREIGRSFDPMARTFWSIPMALAWVSCGSVDDVRNQWDEYRAAAGDGPAAWDDLALSEAHTEAVGGPPSLMPLEQAWSELRAALENGRLIAIGFRAGCSTEEQISTGLWEGMGVATDARTGLVCVPSRPGGCFERVKVRAADLLALFPSQPSSVVTIADKDEQALPVEKAPEAPPQVASRPDAIGAVPINTGMAERPEKNDSASAPKSSARRGRKPQYDRQQFVSAVVEKLKHEGGLAPVNGSNFRQVDLEKHMEGWCNKNWERAPVESTIREFVVAGIAEYEADNSGQ